MRKVRERMNGAEVAGGISGIDAAEAKAPMPPGVRFGRVSFVWRPWLVLVTLVLAAAAS